MPSEPTIRPFRPRDAAARHLSACDPDFRALIGRVGRSRLACDRRSPYEALVRAIAHQQVHGRAAEAILGRLIALCPDEPFPSPERLLALPEGAVRACGFSDAKTRSVIGIAEAARDGRLPGRTAASRMSDTVLIERLVELRGVGRWTVEMLLMFTLGRPDVLPVDDFGVREGYRRIKRLAVQPTPKALASIGLDWAPHRSTAAWYLWRAAEEKGPR